ncbi:hypothetical protein HT102_09010 [Hoyosella sp. G463]|uniref:Uncharacterized protein n=1 Tax=Lolliginicoccus lacisalsi TaxID=2742202 RepID=A0A927JD41_9ACTN|nr:hypothetical protein [Lolliginicoccus lacisalsi]
MRIYVPVTVRMLQQLVADEQLFPVGGTAFAVTPALREAYASGDEEELAEVAMRDAGRGSLRLLAAEIDGAGTERAGTDGAGTEGPILRRAVLAVDADDAVLRPDLDDAVVKVSGPVRLADVASAHIDLAGAEESIARLLPVIDQADLGDEDAELALGDVEDHDLAWYATQELHFLLELL